MDILWGYSQARLFYTRVSKLVRVGYVMRHQKIATINRAKNCRKGEIFCDIGNHGVSWTEWICVAPSQGMARVRKLSRFVV